MIHLKYQGFLVQLDLLMYFISIYVMEAHQYGFCGPEMTLLRFRVWYSVIKAIVGYYNINCLPMLLVSESHIHQDYWDINTVSKQVKQYYESTGIQLPLKIHHKFVIVFFMKSASQTNRIVIHSHLYKYRFSIRGQLSMTNHVNDLQVFGWRFAITTNYCTYDFSIMSI